MNLHKNKHTSCLIRRSQLLNVCGWRCFCDNGSEMTLLPLLILSHLLAYVLDDNFICRAARDAVVRSSLLLVVYLCFLDRIGGIRRRMVNDWSKRGQSFSKSLLLPRPSPSYHMYITCIGYYSSLWQPWVATRCECLSCVKRACAVDAKVEVKCACVDVVVKPPRRNPPEF